MSDPRDEISKIIANAERAAYSRGWQDAIEAITSAAQGIKPHEYPKNPAPEIRTTARIAPRLSGRPASKAIQVVEDCIAASPGMKGVQVVKAVQTVDSSINERTVRTCLRRLRINKSIWQRNNLWYPKVKRSEHENEEVISPPHH